jgi:hypothetical protein
MGNITSSAELKNAIKLLEIEKAGKEKLLKDQFVITYESLKPVNLINNFFKDISTSPVIFENFLSSAAGMASGFVTRKIVEGKSGSLLRKIFGSLLQFGITNFIAKHPDAIKSFGHFIIEQILRKKEKNSSPA